MLVGGLSLQQVDLSAVASREHFTQTLADACGTLFPGRVHVDVCLSESACEGVSGHRCDGMCVWASGHHFLLVLTVAHEVLVNTEVTLLLTFVTIVVLSILLFLTLPTSFPFLFVVVVVFIISIRNHQQHQHHHH